jgi:hypothetical protein
LEFESKVRKEERRRDFFKTGGKKDEKVENGVYVDAGVADGGVESRRNGGAG